MISSLVGAAAIVVAGLSCLPKPRVSPVASSSGAIEMGKRRWSCRRSCGGVVAALLAGRSRRPRSDQRPRFRSLRRRTRTPVVSVSEDVRVGDFLPEKAYYTMCRRSTVYAKHRTPVVNAAPFG